MNLPLIGITTRTAPVQPSNLNSVMIQKSYTDAVINAGGIPLLIPSEIDHAGWLTLVERLDGILFTGGGDIDIKYFNGEPNSAVYGVDVSRDELELGLVKLVIEKDLPFLGICRGLQVLNVALGGTLYTHIPAQLKNALTHENPAEDGIKTRTELLHNVNLVAGTRMQNLTGEVILQVNSLHHQGVKDLAPGLLASGFASDGLVEAVELPGNPFGIAVQWHPEWITNQASARRLFQAFVAAASENQR